MEKAYFQVFLSDVGYKQFRKPDSVIHLKGARRPSTSQVDVDQIQEAFLSNT
jgi:hypothetical protein